MINVQINWNKNQIKVMNNLFTFDAITDTVRLQL